ncbi:Hypothetical predicted protein [Paramuricea clavata]|uniref:Uncharacterized protein n=1 Tax=Paramuricea clavata TaxID=317549 RepID=A0A7D9JJT3_PARCT|nr:Hypothetical predicted protein [Paramuricea clavata]
MSRVSKPRSRVRQQDKRPSSYSTVRRNTEQFGRVINFGVEESLPRTQVFLRWRLTGAYNASTERKRTSRHEYAAIQHSNRSSKQHFIYFQREGQLQRRPTGADYVDCFTVDLVVLRKPTRHINRDSCR